MDKGVGFRRNSTVLGEIIVTLLYFLVGRIGILGFEGRHAIEQSVEYDSDAPDIDLEMIPFSFQDLRSDIVGSTTDSSLALSLELQFGSQSKITNFNTELVINKDIA